MLMVVSLLYPTSSLAVLSARQRHPALPAPHRRLDALGCITTSALATLLHCPRSGCAHVREVLLECHSL